MGIGYAAYPVFSITPTSSTQITMSAYSVETIQYRVTNNSSRIHTLAMMPITQKGVVPITSGDDNCSNPVTLDAHQSCLLSLQLIGSLLPSYSEHIPIICQTINASNVPDPLFCYQPTVSDYLRISVFNTKALLSSPTSRLDLIAGGPPGFITVINNSLITTALNVSLILPSDWMDVIQDASDCTTLLPGSSCRIQLTPGTTAHPPTTVHVQGTDATSFELTIAVNSFTSLAAISVQGSPLVMYPGGPAGVITVTNESSSLAAHNITIMLTPDWTDVIEDASDCVNLPVGANCQITLTPGTLIHNPVQMPVQGTNTTTETIIASVNRPSTSPITVIGSPLALYVNGSQASLIIINNSPYTTAMNIQANLTSTPLAGAIVQDSSDCLLLPPAQSCMLRFTPGTTGVSPTEVPIQGDNTSTAIATISVLDIGVVTGGGKIGCLTQQGGTANLVTALEDNIDFTQWGTYGTLTNATSLTDGAANTAAIIAALGDNDTSAASICSLYQADSAGNSPCQAGNTCYTDWFLPAINQLFCLYQNKVKLMNFSPTQYWSSTETGTGTAYYLAFGTTPTQGSDVKGYPLRVRCVRAFTIS